MFSDMRHFIKCRPLATPLATLSAPLVAYDHAQIAETRLSIKVTCYCLVMARNAAAFRGSYLRTVGLLQLGSVVAEANGMQEYIVIGWLL